MVDQAKICGREAHETCERCFTVFQLMRLSHAHMPRRSYYSAKRHDKRAQTERFRERRLTSSLCQRKSSAEFCY